MPTKKDLLKDLEGIPDDAHMAWTFWTAEDVLDRMDRLKEENETTYQLTEAQANEIVDQLDSVMRDASFDDIWESMDTLIEEARSLG